MVWIAAAGLASQVASGAASYGGARQARKAHDRARRRGDSILGVWDPENHEDPNGAFGQLAARGGLSGVRKEYLQKIMENAEGGFKGAKDQAKRGAHQARRTAKTQGVQAGADVQQDLQARGLYGSTIGQQAQAGISYQTGQALADIDMKLGSMLGDIGLQETATMDQILRGNLAIEEKDAKDIMAYIVGNTGHGAGDSSMFFQHSEKTPGVNPFDVGYGTAGFLSNIAKLFGKGGGGGGDVLGTGIG